MGFCRRSESLRLLHVIFRFLGISKMRGFSLRISFLLISYWSRLSSLDLALVALIPPLHCTFLMSRPSPMTANGNGTTSSHPDTPSDSLASSMILLPPLPHASSSANAAGSSERASKSSFGAESTMSLLVDSLKDRLLFAVPKKGRLHEKCLELLAGAWPHPPFRLPRSFSGRCKG